MAQSRTVDERTIDQLPGEPRGEKRMHAVVMTVGPGARLLELKRSGKARKGIEAWVDGDKVMWLTTDRSALMPVRSGRRVVTFAIRGRAGADWQLEATKPADASGSSRGTLPGSGREIGEFSVRIS